MRIATLLLVLLLAPAALAQPCDPAQTDEVCPDTTDWHRYFPLDVGNQWQYQDNFYGEPVAHWSWTITGEAEVDGQPYFTLEHCDEATDGSATCADPLLIRYDDEHALVVRRTESGETWWNALPCELSAAFNEAATCTGPGAESFILTVLEGAYGAIVEVPPDVVSGDTRKLFEEYPGTGPELYAGLGVTKFYYDLQEHPTRLVYANVGGEQVGTPAFASCDPADANPDVACPDTTDWRRYFPLEVGNEWQYREAVDVDEIVYWGRRIVGEVEIEGRTYFQIERCDEGADGAVTCGDAVPVRYDDEHARVVQYREDGDTGWGLLCDLALPFGGMPQTESGFYECEDLGPDGPLYLGAWGEYDATLQVPPDVVSGNTAKSFGVAPMDIVRLYAGIGPVTFEDELHPEATRLVYAQIDGEEVGTPAFAFPTAGEPGAAQPVTTAFTEAFPNPARGAVRAQYTLGAPQAVTLELIDLLGRRVRSVEMGPQAAGPHDVRLDLGGLRTGVYVLRLRAAGAEATRRIVVVR